MIQVIVFLCLCILSMILLVIECIQFIRFLYHKRKPSVNAPSFSKKTFYAFITSLVLTMIFPIFTQFFANTPAIRDENGVIAENSIAELIPVTLNGREEWISIRGNDSHSPILLFLAGGPGGSQMAAVRHELAELEKYFIVVNWDQPGSGKSYAEGKHNTVQTYMEDGIALSDYLRQRFQTDKIFLCGESWGSALGIFMVSEKPENFYAFIGTGQMVDFLETEHMDYDLAMTIAKEKNDLQKVAKLEANGRPPYEENITWKSAEYLNYLSTYMTHNPAITNRGYNTFRDLFSSEYGIIDKINYLRGIVTTFDHVYPQLYDIDLRKDYPKLEIPIYFFQGRHDINAPNSLVEEYYEILEAPHKELIWFETSGHSPWINESDKFVDELIKIKKHLLNN